MPLYFFHIHDENGVIPDDEGMDLPNDEAAKEEAVTSGRELIKSLIAGHQIVDDRWIEVKTANGTVITTIKLKDLIH